MTEAPKNQIVCHYCGMSTWYEDKCFNPMCDGDISVYRRKSDDVPVIKIWRKERVLTETEYEIICNDPHKFFSIGDWQEESTI